MAFYFDFQYFETDKTVYEIGETIEMAARLIADFSPEGWCYVSFALVTDSGPAFADEYFISSSPSARLVNSSYTILPQHTDPGENGIIAHALFNVEVFDTVSQGAGDSIEVSITRGHLTAIPTSSLTIQSGTNNTMCLAVVSIHDDSIRYSNESINIHVEDSSSVTILNDTISTTLDGTFTLNWSSSMGLPGIYSLTVTGFGNDDFLGFSETLPISVIPAESSLLLLSAPESIQCQSPDGGHFENAEILVRHETANETGIDDSTVYWNSSFGSGVLTSAGNGTYMVLIPFHAQSGVHIINITAINQKYQTASRAISIEAIKNTLQFYPSQSIWSAEHGDTLFIQFSIEEEFDWCEEIVVDFLDDLDEISLSTNVTPDSVDLLLMTCWPNLSVGIHTVHPYVNNGYYDFSNDTPSFQLIVLGEFRVNITLLSAYYGETLDLGFSVLDTNNNTIELVSVLVYYGSDTSPFVTTGQINSTQTVSIGLPLWITPGIHLLRVNLLIPYHVSVSEQVNASVWMRTNMTIIIETGSDSKHSVYARCNLILTDYDWSILSSSSLGSIIRPPPILFSGTTSIEFLTVREISPDNCPKFNSGTSNLSTDSLNSLTASSGKGQIVFNRMDLTLIP
jgi:hypothetical protein